MSSTLTLPSLWKLTVPSGGKSSSPEPVVSMEPILTRDHNAPADGSTNQFPKKRELEPRIDARCNAVCVVWLIGEAVHRIVKTHQVKVVTNLDVGKEVPFRKSCIETQERDLGFRLKAARRGIEVERPGR